MWLKNGMKRFFEIALVTLFLFFLLGNLPYAWAQEQEWHWGLENCTLEDCPEGLVGPFFFQYDNKKVLLMTRLIFCFQEGLWVFPSLLRA